MIKSEYINKIAEVEGINYSDMLPEWNDKQQKQVEKTIRQLFSMKTLKDHRGNNFKMYTFKDIEYFFGLPYTSSSSFAMLGNTNTRFCLDQEEKFNIDCFGLGKDNNLYIFCTDDAENEKIYKVV